jgi:hypothetical protein
MYLSEADKSWNDPITMKSIAIPIQALFIMFLLAVKSFQNPGRFKESRIRQARPAGLAWRTASLKHPV